MDYLHIHQSLDLKGSVPISGAKNAALPILALTLLSDQNTKISNLPNVADIRTLARLLEHLGASVDFETPHTATINAQNIIHTKALYDIVRKMRASILVLGPLLARFKKCEVSLPGGCAIGARPVDLHLKAMEKMGAKISIEGGYIVAKAKRGLQGADILFDKISVTGSENVIMAAALANGKTRILNAAREPEVVQLCEILKNAGIDVQGIGTNEIIIFGTHGELPKFAPISVIPDRIEAGTYLAAGAITNCAIAVDNVIPSHMRNILDKFSEIGFKFAITPSLDGIDKDCDLDLADRISSIVIEPAKTRKAFELITTEHPGFPTDMQAQFMALATQCDGVSVIEERLFENRFMHCSELQRLGADIKLSGNVAKVSGKSNLIGANVMATDLRASSALVLAGLVAKGDTQVHRIYHLDRGYENLEGKFKALGARVARKKEEW